MNEKPQGDSKIKNQAAKGSPSAAGVYAPAENSGRAATLSLVLSAAKRLDYLQVMAANCDGSTAEMIHVRLRNTRTRMAAEMIKADLRTIWCLGVARSSSAIYRFEDTIFGFEFHFALFHEGEFTTGMIVLDLFDSGVRIPA